MRSNRWIILSISLLVVMCQGISYTPNNFKHAIKPTLEQISKTTISDATWALAAISMGFVFLPLGMYLSGLLTDKGRVGTALLIGAVACGGGLVLAGLSQEIVLFAIGFGGLLSIGNGFAYGTCLGAAVRWFPDRKGLAAGLAVAALGVGGMVIPLFQNYLLATDTETPRLANPMHYFHWQALVTFLCIGTASLIVRNPPPKATSSVPPSGQTPTPLSDAQTPATLLRSRTFYGLFAAFFLGTLPGMMLVSNARDLVQYLEGARANQSATLWAPWVVSAWGLCNAIGRVGVGYVSDKAGRKRTLRILYLLTFCVTAGLAAVYHLLPASAGLVGMSAFSCIAALFGGILSLYPALTAETFGSGNLGKNYALMFGAFAATSLAVPPIMSLLRSHNGMNYGLMTWTVAGVALAALVFGTVVFREKKSLEKGSA